MVDSAGALITLDAAGDPDQMAKAVSRAATILTSGGTVVVPTDTVYGVAALASDSGAVARLFALKDRSTSSPLAVLVASVSQGLGLVDFASCVDGPQQCAVTESHDGSSSDRAHGNDERDMIEGSGDDLESLARELVTKWWPGALTLVLPRRSSIADWGLGGDPATIGVRCPSSPVVRAVADRVGPLAVTSANRSGQPTPTSAGQAAQGLAGSVSLVIDAGPCTEPASTVLDLTSHPILLRRVGSIGLTELALPPRWMISSLAESANG